MHDAARQQRLPLELAEAEVRERWARLLAALDRTGADLHLVTFCRMVFEHTAGGAEGRSWRRTAEELRRTPDGLCCGETKLRGVLREAQSARLVRVIRRTDNAGRDDANAYAIDWDGVASYTPHPVVRAGRGAQGADRPAPPGVRHAPPGPRGPGSAGPLTEDQESLERLFDDPDEEDEDLSSSSSHQASGPSRAVDGPTAGTLRVAATIGSQANRLLKMLWPGRPLPALCDEERQFVFQVLLVASQVGEQWLWEAAERVSLKRPSPDRPLAYLRTVLVGDLADARGLSDAEANLLLRRLLHDVRPEARRIERRLRRRPERCEAME